MTYDSGLLEVVRLYGSARLDYGAKLDEIRLDSTSDIRGTIDVASLAIGDGYTIGEGNTLSLDPTTATARMADWVSGDAAGVLATVTPLLAGHRVEVSYNGVLIFQGSVASVSTELTTDPDAQDHGRDYRRTVTYTLAALEYDLLSKVVTWGFGDGTGTGPLPQEPALTRLQRWFTVDTSAVPSAHMANLNVLVDATDSDGSSTMLDQARYFTQATGVPVRVKVAELPLHYDHLVVLDSAVAWTDQPLTPTITSSVDWLSRVTAKDGVPEQVTVTTNDTRFLAGRYSYAFPDRAMDTFRLDVDRLGPASVVQIGYLAPDPVDVLGVTCSVARVTHTFGKETYTCALELAPKKTIGV